MEQERRQAELQKIEEENAKKSKYSTFRKPQTANTEDENALAENEIGEGTETSQQNVERRRRRVRKQKK